MDDYNRISSLYDALIGPFLKPIHKAMLTVISAKQCHTVLDLCCGTGLVAGMVSDKGLKAVGVDLSPAMLKVARARRPAVTFIDGDASSLIFSDDEFDAVTISFGLHEKPAETGYAILAEARRVVRPDGVVLVADYREPVPMQSRLVGLGIAAVERIAGKEHYACFPGIWRRAEPVRSWPGQQWWECLP